MKDVKGIQPGENLHCTFENTESLSCVHGAMGCTSSSPYSDDVIGGIEYVALYNHHPTESGKLRFNKGDTLVVSGNGRDRFTLIGFVKGSTGKRGNFPATYAQKTDSASSTSAPSSSSNRGDVLKTWNRNALPTKSALKTPGMKKRRSRIRITSGHTVGETYSRHEYERAGDFDPERSANDWDVECEMETLRMLRDRWQYMERDLPPGAKCAERLAWERNQNETKRREQEEKEKRRAEFLARRQQVRQAQQMQNPVSPEQEPENHDIRIIRTSRGDTMKRPAKKLSIQMDDFVDNSQV